MHSGFGNCDAFEESLCSMQFCVRQIALLEHTANIAPVSVYMFGRMLNIQHQSSEAMTLSLTEQQFDLGQSQRLNLLSDILLVGTRIDKGSQSHVSSNSAVGVEVSNCHS